MPVSTRSKILNPQEQPQQQCLKEKLKALTQLYEHHKQNLAPSAPVAAAARKLALPPESGSRILVFVRVRPMGKKEKEAGSRCCVRIADRRDVYITEFSTANDYLRLKRVRGRHFTFDASFPDSATQNQVYSTT